MQYTLNTKHTQILVILKTSKTFMVSLKKGFLRKVSTSNHFSWHKQWTLLDYINARYVSVRKLVKLYIRLNADM